MQLEHVFQESLVEWEWEDEIIREDGDESIFYVKTPYEIEDVIHNLTIIVWPQRSLIRFLISSPIDVPKNRLHVAFEVINYLNRGLWMGGFVIAVEEEAGEILFLVSTTVEGTEASIEQFSRLRGEAYQAFNKETQRVFRLVSETKASAAEIISVIE